MTKIKLALLALIMCTMTACVSVVVVDEDVAKAMSKPTVATCKACKTAGCVCSKPCKGVAVK
jgi:hypothetical protein